jgi:uncharacterized membrane protein YbhN (UPF0104 family)
VLRLLWIAVPITGVPGPAELALILSLTALGAPLASAGAGVLAFRLVTFWGPVAVGAVLASRLERRLLL